MAIPGLSEKLSKLALLNPCLKFEIGLIMYLYLRYYDFIQNMAQVPSKFFSKWKKRINEIMSNISHSNSKVIYVFGSYQSLELLKYGSEEKGSWLYKCSILLCFIMSKKHERLRSELLSEDKITNLLGFLT